MRRRTRITCLAALVVLLAGCGDRAQTLGAAVRHDAAAFNGTASPYMAPGWKPGDRSSWEQHLRARMQNGQNDYSKAD